MKFWSQWIRRRSSKRINKIKSRQLRSENLESRQLLAGDVLQADQGVEALMGQSFESTIELVLFYFSDVVGDVI